MDNDDKNLAHPSPHYGETIKGGDAACLCGLPQTPEFASATHCQWCGTLKGLKLPEGSQIHVWFSNGAISGIVLTIVPCNRGGTWFLVDPATGLEREIDSRKWLGSAPQAEANSGILSYQMDVALGFAMSLGGGAFGATRARLGRQPSDRKSVV